jgi:hypothetical protein
VARPGPRAPPIDFPYEFRIEPANVRIGQRVLRGYQRLQFEDAWATYLAPVVAQGGSRPLQRYNADEIRTSSIFQGATPEDDVALQKCKKPNNDGHCSGVASWNGGADAHEASARLCDHCGHPESPADPLHLWDWPGRPDGILLHQRCEEPWLASEGGPPWPADGNGSREDQ